GTDRDDALVDGVGARRARRGRAVGLRGWADLVVVVGEAQPVRPLRDARDAPRADDVERGAAERPRDDGSVRVGAEEGARRLVDDRHVDARPPGAARAVDDAAYRRTTDDGWNRSCG